MNRRQYGAALLQKDIQVAAMLDICIVPP